MAELYKLDNPVKHYAWGSPDWIPALTGQSNPQALPWAELWMGTHPGGPSKITISEKNMLLSDIVTLPFLLKYLAAFTPLSIQAHPNLIQAQEGYERENKAGIDLAAAERNYKDPNHKPEYVCALTPFTAMAGFREAAETEQLFSFLPDAESKKLRSSLKNGHLSLLTALFNLGDGELKTINSWALKIAETPSEIPIDTNKESSLHNSLLLCGKFAQLYPNDPGILSPLYLNVLELAPYQCFYIPAGILHAYVYGFAMECMANSDNVLRGGLTPKYIDTNELFNILSFDPFKPEILEPKECYPGCFSYGQRKGADTCTEFSLYLLQSSSGNITVEMEKPEMGIFTVFNGNAKISVTQNDTDKTMFLKQGESIFISKRSAGEQLLFNGDFTIFAALG